MPRGLQVSVVLSPGGLQSGGSIERRMETAWMDKENDWPLSWQAQERKLLLQRTSYVLTKSAVSSDLAWLLQTTDSDPGIPPPLCPASLQPGKKTKLRKAVPERIKRGS